MQQIPIVFIPHQVANALVSQRSHDGYINATAMCQAAGKLFGHYTETKLTQAFLAELSSDIGIPISELIQVVKGGIPELQGSWAHPRVAIHLGQWLSPVFAVKVSGWVYDWMSGAKPSAPVMPYHIARYMLNAGQVPHTHFSILQEITLSLIAPLETRGYTIPANMVPDISEGQLFARWMREQHGVDTDALQTYTHTYEDGRVCQAKLYPNDHLPKFKDHFYNEWMKKRARAYFADKDRAAIPHIEAILALPPPATSPGSNTAFRKSRAAFKQIPRAPTRRGK